MTWKAVGRPNDKVRWLVGWLIECIATKKRTEKPGESGTRCLEVVGREYLARPAI